MHIALGVVVDEDSVTAALVDVDLPQLGPVDERTTRLGGGDVGDAVAAAIGVMSLRAKRADLGVHDTAVALADPSLWTSVSRALEHHLLTGVALVDLDRLSAVDPDGRYGAPVGAALWADRGATVAAPVEIADAPDAPPRTSPRRRGMAVVGAGVAAAVIAASVTVWAATTAPRVVSEPTPGAVEQATSNGTDGTTVPPTPGVATPPSNVPQSSPSPDDGNAVPGADGSAGDVVLRPAVPAPVGSPASSGSSGSPGSSGPSVPFAARPDSPSVPRPQSGGGSPSAGGGTSSGGGGTSGGGTSGGGTTGGGSTGTPGTGSPGTGGGTPSTGGGSTTVDPPVVTPDPTETDPEPEPSVPNDTEPQSRPSDGSTGGE
ncbi:hypothetical protein [Rhodococcoides corynebacterioides]|uniref:hypothetical protein n=1 Tax=Rhodococcoides corynebacterioides TaxID=53972 RepID=UPI001C9B7264|nr:hypothetical protein [Rhodococcus corynebacterioides]MBY6361485.1 hypothetical protein [Rhodococcus corynebacterioides]